MSADRVAETVTIAGNALEVERIAAADPKAPTIVLLHEGLGCVSLWRDFPERLAARTGCAALVYSRHGYGRSAVNRDGFEPDYMHHEALEVLPALLDHYGLADPLLYGHSDGASIALIHAGGSGRGVSGLIVEAPHVFVEPESITGIEAARDAFAAGDLADRLARHHTDARATFHAWNDAWLDPRFRDWNIEGYLPGISAPVLMVQGEEDAYGTLAQLDAIARGVGGPCDRLVLPGCGHAPHREAGGAVLEAVGRFLDRVAAMSC